MVTPWIEAAALTLALVLGVTLSIAVVATSPRRRANRLLAAILFLSGVTTWLYGDWGAVTTHPATAAFNALSTALLSIFYVEFLVEVLDTPVVAPLRRRRWLRMAVALALLVSLAPMAFAFRDALAVAPFDIDAVYAAQGPALLLSLVVLLYALVASVSAWRRAAPGSATRARAGHFALAFGARDATVVLAILALFLPDPLGIGGLLWPLATILSVPLLAYGILRSQLFDIELRLKEGVRRATVVGVLVAVAAGMLVAVQRAPSTAVRVAAGAIGIAVLLVALVPLERMGARLADRLFPEASADPEYLARRKLEVYRAALEDQLVRDATGSAADPVLAQLRRTLGVTKEQHDIFLVALKPRPSLASAVPEPFEVVSELGRGGFGRALLARDRHLDRYVVLKQPLGLLTAGSAGRDLFLREARLAAQIQHPNVVAVHQVLLERDPPILVLEHVDGESLADRLAREGALPPAEVARIGLDVLAGLDRIHRAGIVHRDLKPANILLARDGTAKITDFGVAHAPADAASAGALTTMGSQPGSPAYMSPEQARGRPVDARSDLYSLGVVIHEALTGRLPPTGRATVAAHRLPVSLDPPPAFADTIERALAQDPARRFADAAEMSAALRRAAVARS